VSNSITLGVVGHVDHGKTALVRALTGIETDRLLEERERGLSIVLGFAYLEDDRGVVDLIDVPGHEDFIRAMISGATSLDGIVLCVAANESVMPQTVEHFNIARLLGVERGFIVITKCDLVDDEMLMLVRDEIEEFVQGTFLDGAPVLDASATTGEGIDAVRDQMLELAEVPVEREHGEKFFLPLDRVFTMRGFGLVGTGTLRGGELGVGEEVEIQPSGQKATVRALQNHNQAVECAGPGQRVAVNLRHVSREDVRRGDVLATPGTVAPTRRVDVQLSLLEDTQGPIANGAVLRFLTGTIEAIAKLRLLDRRVVEAGESVMAQLDLDRDIATRASEHFLVRTYSPMLTLGGGRVIDANAQRHRRFDQAVTERLAAVATGDPELVLAQRLEEAGPRGVNLAELAGELGAQVERLANAAASADVIEIGDDIVVGKGAYEATRTGICSMMERFHAANPFSSGIDAGSLAKDMDPQPGAEVLRHALRELVAQKQVRATQEVYSLASYDPFAQLSDRERRLVRDIEATFLSSGIEPPSPKTVVGADKVGQGVYRLLLESGRLVRLKTYDRKSELVLHASALENVKQAIAREFPYPAAFALKDIRDLLGSTRKYIVPLMEHLDASGATVRRGDLRRLREQQEA
jgi:selenocysteine-specific elongation factor